MDSRLHRIFSGAGGAGGGMGGPHPDSPLVDSSEQVYISSLALLKMLKHGIFFLSCDFSSLFTCVSVSDRSITKKSTDRVRCFSSNGSFSSAYFF